MARRPNYRFERFERQRTKAAKKAKRAEAKQAARDQKRETKPDGEDPRPEDEATAEESSETSETSRNLRIPQTLRSRRLEHCPRSWIALAGRWVGFADTGFCVNALCVKRPRMRAGPRAHQDARAGAGAGNALPRNRRFRALGRARRNWHRARPCHRHARPVGCVTPVRIPPSPFARPARRTRSRSASGGHVRRSRSWTSCGRTWRRRASSAPSWWAWRKAGRRG